MYSPENPEVLFEQSYLDLANADISAKNGDVVCYATDDQTKEIFNELVSNSHNLEESIVENISDSKQLIGILTAKVGVEEIYEISEEGAPVCVSSKLQAPFEDSECGIKED